MEQLFQQILKEALRLQVTDLHFKSKEVPCIEMRYLGKIQPFKTLDLSTYQKLMAYLQYRANIDFNQHQKPQTGSFQYCLDEHIYYFRLSYLPSNNDVHLVLRLLNHQKPILFEELTKDELKKKSLRQLFKKESGLIVICGPTGSGKSTTLHAFLEEILKTEQKNIITIEDPIEIYHEGMVQIQVNEDHGIRFENALKQVLRHDPDVVMIGEIRDEISAGIALRLALTGHLVLTTLHAFSVKTALTRLENLGLKKDDLNEVLKGLISQRLIYTPEPLCFFEIAVKEDLKVLLETNKVQYQTMTSTLIEAKEKGWVNETQIEAYLD